MSTSRSYADLMASRPPSAALRKPLLHSSPSRSLPIKERHDANTSASTSAIADSPRRLLSYYLSKAAYNTDETEAAQTPLADKYIAQGDAESSRRTAFTPRGVESVLQVNATPAAPTSSTLLRPPPFVKSAFSNGLRPRPASTQASQPPSPSHPLRAALLSTRSGAHVGIKIQGSPAPPEKDNNTPVTVTPPPTSAPAKWEEERTAAVVESTDDAYPGPPVHSQLQRRSPPTPAVSSSMPGCITLTAEQQRQFEEDVLSQVETLLQAQRSDHRAEIEAYRVTAGEAQATLGAVEKALAEQLGLAAAAHLTSPSPPSTSASVPRRSPQGPSSSLDVEVLAQDMSRVAAAAAPSATQMLLDAIMSIRDGQDVPTILLHVVEELFDELTRALVPPVMDFVQLPQHPEPQPHQAGVGDTKGSGNNVTSQDEALWEAQANIAALQEEVKALRHVLDGRLESGCVLSPSSASAGRTPVTPSGAAVRRVLLERFFTECHAMLTRSRQEGLKLLRDLEEERRLHFLTRIRLLKPAPASTPTLPLTSASAPALLTKPHDSAASPITRSTTASQERREPASSVSTDRGASYSSPSALRPEAAVRSAPHHSSLTRSPARLAVRGKERREKGDDSDKESSSNCENDAPDYAPLPYADERSHTERVPLSRGQPAQSTLPSALRVAEEVLRTTAGRRDATDTSFGHPYYADSSKVSRGYIDAALTEAESEDDSAQLRWRQRGFGGPSVSFVEEAPLRASRDVSQNFRQGHLDNSLSSSAFSRKADSASAVIESQPNSEHEKRVWNKTVELLSRYSVA